MEHKDISLQIEYLPLDAIRPFERNPRTHSKDQIAQVARSIESFGFVNPIIIDEDSEIIAGHGRLLAAKSLGLEKVPTIRLAHLSEAEKKALLIADNRIAENAGWDHDTLVELLQEIEEARGDLSVLGFTNKELEAFREDFEVDEEAVELANDVPAPEDKSISRMGDIWVLGEHELMCGDATSAEDLAKLMGGETAHMVFTDPPYNVNYGNALRDKLAGTAGERTILNDNLGEGFGAFLYASISNFMKHTTGSVYICMGGSELHTLRAAFEQAGGKWESYIVWVKNSFTLTRAKHQHQHEWVLFGNPTSPYEGGHEEVLFGAKKGAAPPWYGGRNQSDVWEFPRPQKAELHPTMKPVELVERAIRNSSQTMNLVLDPFGGSGSTLIACERTGRRCRMMELDPQYADVVVKRWESFTGKAATHKDSGKTFAEMEKERATPGGTPDQPLP